jgi:8-amino-7-oxononanoate synthase
LGKHIPALALKASPIRSITGDMIESLAKDARHHVRRSPSALTPRGLPWIDHWLATCNDLAQLTESHPMMDAVIDEVDGRMIRIGERWLAELYVDDAHGFGVIGERSPREQCPLGIRGNSIVRYFDESYDNVVLVGGFSKAYSSLLAFIACPTAVKNLLKISASPYLYSGPSPVASLATVLVGLDVNDKRGDDLRRLLYERTGRVLDCLARLGVYTPNHSGFPIIEIPLRDHRRIGEVGQFLFDRGVYVTLAAFPLVPKADVGFRAQVTAANTDAEIDCLCAAIEELAYLGELRPAGAAPESQARAA